MSDAEAPKPIGRIEVKNITQVFDGTTVIKDLNIDFKKPYINMLMGPSGCGKSTVLKMLGGVRPYNVKVPTRGKVLIDGERCNEPHDDVVMVFQQYCNFPALTVRENIAFPFKSKLWSSRVPKAEQDARVEAIIKEVGLEDRADGYPYELSGGQNQRVALARALVLRPRVLLMDEPFAALDIQTRHEVQELLVELWKTYQCQVVFVTHDVNEALKLGNRIIVLSTRPAKVNVDFEIAMPHGKRNETWMRTEKALAHRNTIERAMH